MVPQTGSLALDRGFAFGLTSDQRGRSRPFDDPAIPNASGGDGSDIGAVEIGSGPAPISVVSRKVHDVNLNQSFDIQLSADTRETSVAVGAPVVITRSSSPLAHQLHSPPLPFGSGTGGMVSERQGQWQPGNSQSSPPPKVTKRGDYLIFAECQRRDNQQQRIRTNPAFWLATQQVTARLTRSDVSLTKLKSGQTVDATTFRNDVTVNNSINASGRS